MGMPKPPDPKETAAAQADTNRDTAITQYTLGAANQNTPFGSLSYDQSGWYDPNQGFVSMDAGQGADTSGWTPRFTATQTLSPQLEGISNNFLNAGNTLSSNLRDTLSNPIDMSGLPDRQTAVNLGNVSTDMGWNGPDQRYEYGGDNPIQMEMGPENYSEDRRRVEEALLSRINPSLEQDRSRLEADLRARGISPGSGQAYNNAVDELNRQGTDARMAAILSGGQEQSRLAGLDLAQGQFANSAQEQAYRQAAERANFFNAAQNAAFGQNAMEADFGRSGRQINNQNELTEANFTNEARRAALEELYARRAQPINEISSLLSGTQIAGPQFTSTPQPGVNGVDYAGLVNNNYQARLQGAQGMWGGLAGIGSSLLSGAGAAGGFGALFSDRRLKDNIKRIGTLDNGLGVYSYRYKGSDTTRIGVMADEVRQVNPSAVHTHASGYDMVDYAEAVH